jgi:hypothetical protein
LALKALGYIMIAFSIAMAITLAATGVGLGTASITLLSITGLLGGMTIFSGRRKGLSQDMVRLASTPEFTPS